MSIDLSLTPENLLVQESVRDFVAREITPHIRDWDRGHEVPPRGVRPDGRAGLPGRAHLGALGRRGHGLHQPGHPVRGAGAGRYRLPGGHERPRRAQLADPDAVGDRGAEAALAGAPGARREAGHVRAHGARRGHGRGGHHHHGHAATATRTSSTAPSSGSASRTSPTTSWCSRPSTDRCATGASRRSCSSGAWPGSRRAPSRASWASMPATPVPSRSTGCGCPLEHRIGEEGEGFAIAMSAIDQGRYTVATGSVGLAQACLDASVRYAHERRTFGEEIGRHQLVKQMIAKMGQGIEAGRLLCRQVAWLKDRGQRNTRETSLAKWFCTDHAVQCALDAIQVHGAYGYSDEFPVERYLRNSKAARHLRGHQPAAHAHPGRLPAGLPGGRADAHAGVADPGRRSRLRRALELGSRISAIYIDSSH